MIESLQLKNLRGIREGTLEGITRLTVLVGPNSSGKSTVLDALWIATTLNPGDSVGRIVRRRTEKDADARWLLWRRGIDGPAVVSARNARGGTRTCSLSWVAEVPSAMKHKLTLRKSTGPFTCIESRYSSDSQSLFVSTVFAANNTYVFEQEPETLPDDLKIEPAGVGFLDMRGGKTGRPLPNLYSDAVTQGRREEVLGLLNELVPGLRSIEILVNEQNEPVLHLVFSDHSVPVALMGDGIRSMLRLCLVLAVREQKPLLIEEPEVHQHPRALQQSARALIASMRRGTQIVLSTHSLELIDALLLEATQDDLQHLSTYRLNLSEGKLVSSRLGGDEMSFARGQIAEDLR